MLGARAGARFVKSRAAMGGASLVGVVVLFAVVGPMVASHGPLASDFVHGISPNGLPVGPNARFFLGTDRIFRDVFARLAFAGRLSLAIAFCATAMASSIGAVVGVAAGWHEGHRTRVPWPGVIGVCAAAAAFGFGQFAIGWGLLATGVVGSTGPWRAGPAVDVDAGLMRLVDILLALPFLVLVLAIGAALDRASALTVLCTLGATSWLGIARILRVKTMQVRSLEYVAAARALGRSTFGILRSHVLPNVAGTLVVTSTTLVAQMIVADSVLSYLGIGISPPTPTWGRMLHEGQDAYATAPWLVAAPGAAILLAVWGFNLLGEGLRDALDPNDD